MGVRPSGTFHPHFGPPPSRGRELVASVEARQIQREFAAAAGRRACGDYAAVRFGHAAHEREPQAPAATARIEPGLEETGLRFARNAATRIADRDPHRFRVGARAQFDVVALQTGSDGVLEEAYESPRQRDPRTRYARGAGLVGDVK